MEYTFNLLLSFLFGVLLKIYDDIIDEKLKIDVFYIDLLKYFLITVVSIVCYNDFIISIILFEFLVLSFLMDKYYTSKLENSKDTIEEKDLTCMNDTVWIYISILLGVFIIYHIINLNSNWLTTFTIYDYKIITLLVAIISIIFAVPMEIYISPEHSSNNKLYSRIFVLLLSCISFYYMIPFSDYIYDGIYGFTILCIGALSSSVSFLTLKKYHVFDYLKHKNN
jgi:hypothetical protein